MAKDRVCFVISPIGDDTSPTRRAIDGLMEAVIKPTLRELGYRVEVAHQISRSGSITNQVLELVLGAELVVANLSELNPNVMYELAVRHAARKPVVTIAEMGTRLPFDVADQRTIFYRNDMAGVPELKEALATAAGDAVAEEQPDNPVYRAVQTQVMRDIAPADKDQFVIDRMDRLESLVRQVMDAQQGSTYNLEPSLETLSVMRLPDLTFAFEGTSEEREKIMEALMANRAVRTADSRHMPFGKEVLFAVNLYRNSGISSKQNFLRRLAKDAGLDAARLVITYG